MTDPDIGDTVIASRTNLPPVVITVERIVHVARGKGYPDVITGRTTIVGRDAEGKLSGHLWRNCMLAMPDLRRVHEAATANNGRLRKALADIVEAWDTEPSTNAGDPVDAAIEAAREVLAS